MTIAMTAASQLLGLELSGGWKVTKHLARGSGATGGLSPKATSSNDLEKWVF